MNKLLAQVRMVTFSLNPPFLSLSLSSLAASPCLLPSTASTHSTSPLCLCWTLTSTMFLHPRCVCVCVCVCVLTSPVSLYLRYGVNLCVFTSLMSLLQGMEWVCLFAFVGFVCMRDITHVSASEVCKERQCERER